MRDDFKMGGRLGSAAGLIAGGFGVAAGVAVFIYFVPRISGVFSVILFILISASVALTVFSVALLAIALPFQAGRSNPGRRPATGVVPDAAIREGREEAAA